MYFSKIPFLFNLVLLKKKVDRSTYRFVYKPLSFTNNNHVGEVYNTMDLNRIAMNLRASRPKTLFLANGYFREIWLLEVGITHINT